MISALDKIRQLKTQAKNRRDLERFDRAAHILEEAISLARTELDNASVLEYQSQLASELADCYGMLGGIHRRWGLGIQDTEERQVHLGMSIDAYDHGYQVEMKPEYKLDNSYNMVNRLVGRLLLKPDVGAAIEGDAPTGAAGGTGREVISVRHELEKAADTLGRQLSTTRRRDYWALADLAVTNVLLGKQDPAAAYSRFNAESPPQFAYRSVLDTLRPLSEIRSESSPQLLEAVNLLEHRAAEL